MLRLNRTLGRASGADPDDVLGVKRALARLRYYDPPTGEFHSYPDADLFEGVEAFQRDRDLTVDGVMKPGGPTEAGLNEALNLRPQPAPVVPWRHQPQRPGESGAAVGAPNEGPFGSRLLPKRANDPAPSWRTMELRPGDMSRSYVIPLSAAGADGDASPSPARSSPNLLKTIDVRPPQAGERPAPRPPIPHEKPDSNPPPLDKPVAGAAFRRRDSWGSGAFAASRDGGARMHEGIDVESPPRAPVTSAVDGKVTKFGYVYNGEEYRYVEVTTPDGHVVRHFYVAPKPGLKDGDAVKAGATPIGTVQDVTKKYPGITNHVHVEMRYSGAPGRMDHPNYKDYRLIDPTDLFRGMR